jgi:MFS family permease
MSQEYAWPATWRREQAPLAAGEPPAATPFGDLAPVLALGGLPQALDGLVFAALALAVFPQVFFQALSPAAGVAAAAAVWAIAYLVAWPVRAAVVRFDRRRDARPRLALARVLFAGASLAIAVLPAARHAAAAPLLLVLARAGQGLALGGLAHGRLACDVQPAEERRLRRRSWALAAGLALVVGGVVLGILAVGLPQADFLAWGWRYPFAMALALNMAGLFADLRVESERGARRVPRRPALRLVTVAGAPV